MKWKQKKRRWIEKNCKKKAACKKSHKHTYTRNSFLTAENVNGRRNGSKYYELVAPQNFSVYDNHEETTAYLVDIYNAVIKGLHNKTIYLDFKKITSVSIESIVYIIAILKNVRLLPQFTYEINGNFPENESAREIFEESGFLKYVRSRSKRLPVPEHEDRIQIVSGDKCDTETTKKACDFAMKTGLITIEERRQLYKVLIELMSNTVQHAYNKEERNRLLPAWYLYCQDTGEKVIFNFVDIGYGIPHTINKKWGIKEAFLKDSAAIVSAMRGEFRSETKKPNRGKGLPLISEKIKEGMIQNFKVVSEKGCCYYDCSYEDFQTIEYSNAIFGTIFYWEMGRRVSV